MLMQNLDIISQMFILQSKKEKKKKEKILSEAEIYSS